MFTKNLSDRSERLGLEQITPGLLCAIVFHSFYNHLLLSPLLPTAALVILFPIAFRYSERATHKWLGGGLDTDLEVLNMILSGDLPQTKIGRYLNSLRDRFAGEILADMICLIRTHVELSIRAKGLFLLREKGFDFGVDTAAKQQLEELRYLEKSVGKTGMYAISPFLRTSSRDLWQIYMLTKR